MELGKLKRSIVIRRFLLNSIKAHNIHVIHDAMEAFGVTRQTVYNHLIVLVEKGYLVAEGKTRARVYHLGANRSHSQVFRLKELQESRVYYHDFNIVFCDIPKDLEDICHYGFTEMLNNAIDHSKGESVVIDVIRTSESITITITDDGEGIFNHIARVMQLSDPRESILELSKGKLTTDPDNHTGQGIFFTSRAFDEFKILSDDLFFSHDDGDPVDFLLHGDKSDPGTTVIMRIAMNSKKELSTVFKEFCGDENNDDYAFNKTVVPLRLALFEGGKLLSRSQAKRILNRVEKFKYVVLDFKGIDFIGQAFADEVFRVFARRNPQIQLSPFNMSKEIEKMISMIKNNSD